MNTNLNYNSIKKEFGATNAVSHMLRTPITCILGFTHLFSTENLTSHQKKCLQNIEKSACQLLAATENLLLELKQGKSNVK